MNTTENTIDLYPATRTAITRTLKGIEKPTELPQIREMLSSVVTPTIARLLTPEEISEAGLGYGQLQDWRRGEHQGEECIAWFPGAHIVDTQRILAALDRLTADTGEDAHTRRAIMRRASGIQVDAINLALADLTSRNLIQAVNYTDRCNRAGTKYRKTPTLESQPNTRTESAPAPW